MGFSRRVAPSVLGRRLDCPRHCISLPKGIGNGFESVFALNPEGESESRPLTRRTGRGQEPEWPGQTEKSGREARGSGEAVALFEVRKEKLPRPRD
jgi:hypothetical protein